MKRSNITQFLSVAFLLLLGITSCRDRIQSPPIGASVYRPVYLDKNKVKEIWVDKPRALNKPGKIYYKDNILYINEKLKGVHVIDNSNPRNPVPMGFIYIPGNTDIAIKGNTMYADNRDDMVAIDISSAESIKVISRIEKLYPEAMNMNQDLYPPYNDVWFECPDTSKGYIIDWILVGNAEKAECFR